MSSRSCATSADGGQDRHVDAHELGRRTAPPIRTATSVKDRWGFNCQGLPDTAEEEAMSRGTTAKPTTSRFDVRSADGTSLAVWVDGDGPPLVLVHGSLLDHTISEPLVNELRDGVTTFSMDRRGFGASGDAAGYSIEWEFEDVAAVVEAVASRTGGPVALWGHSYGAGCAMGGAAITSSVHHLVLYEPGLGIAYPAGWIETIEAAAAAGDMEAAIVAVLVDILELTEEDIDATRASPRWPVLLAAGPTVPRECRAENSWVYRPGQFDGIAAPTLLLAGSQSPPGLTKATHQAAAAIPDTRIRVLEGHGHLAFQTDPAMVATVIRQFIVS
jgi:pimeloyl-ACP methyl ester carboxylesterase